jgi:hypothetical protein
VSKYIVMRILRGLSSKFLPCGCVVGIYETYDSETVAVLDVKSDSCADIAHRLGNVVPLAANASDSRPGSTATRQGAGESRS